jgi:hypothetical protein
MSLAIQCPFQPSWFIHEIQSQSSPTGLVTKSVKALERDTGTSTELTRRKRRMEKGMRSTLSRRAFPMGAILSSYKVVYCFIYSFLCNLHKAREYFMQKYDTAKRTSVRTNIGRTEKGNIFFLFIYLFFQVTVTITWWTWCFRLTDFSTCLLFG